MSNESDQSGRKISVTIAGLGVIGSHLVPHMARDPRISSLILVDGDSYNESNLGSQLIGPGDVGRFKSQAQARRVRELGRGSDLVVTPIVGRVEDVPMGLLRSDLCLGCLDSRSARAELSRICWRLGMKYIDAGVEGDGMLARISTFFPVDGGRDAPCVECAFNERDYQSLSQVYSCEGQAQKTAPTRAPAALGALAAAMQAIEARKILFQEPGHCATRSKVLVDMRWHKHYVTTLTRNPACRFDHRVWDIRPLRGMRKLRQIFESCASDAPGGAGPSLAVEGRSWVGQLACAHCGARKEILYLQGRLRDGQLRCVSCGRQMVPVAFNMSPRLVAESIGRRRLGRSPASVGLRSGDVLIAEGCDWRWELCD